MMKQAGLKRFSFPIVILLLFIFIVSTIYVLAAVAAAPKSTPISPIGGSWITSFPMNFTFSCNSFVTNSTNTSSNMNASLYHNVGGAFIVNFTAGNGSWTDTGGIINESVTYNFTQVESIAENNTGYTWNVQCANNQTGDVVFASSNVSFKVDTIKPTIPAISSPTNGSTIGSLNPFIRWSSSGEINFKKYTIQFSNDTDFDTADIIKQQLIFVNSTTNTTFTEALPDNTLFFMRVLAEDDAGNTDYEYINVTTTVGSAKVDVITSPNLFSSDTTFKFEITATAQFLDVCELWLSNSTNGTFVGSFNNTITSWTLNMTNNSRTNGTMFFELPDIMEQGVYLYGFRCNNTGGNSSGFTVNRTITIDSISPEEFGCFFPVINTKSIDHIPEFR